jgi:hypothetical protein
MPPIWSDSQLAEIPREMGDLEIENFEVVGEQAGDAAVAPFEDAADEHGGPMPHDRVVAAPHR